MQAQVTFGNFRFEPATARLWDNSAEVRLTRKAALLLGALLERPGTPVSKQELFANVWRGTVVSDDALVTCPSRSRAACAVSKLVPARHPYPPAFFTSVKPNFLSSSTSRSR
jgi:hypothetical protein